MVWFEVRKAELLCTRGGNMLERFTQTRAKSEQAKAAAGGSNNDRGLLR